MSRTQALVNELSADKRIVGIAMCGSVRAGLSDQYSDTDIWVFLAPTVPATKEFALSQCLPSWATAKVLQEGKDASVSKFAVVHLLIEDTIVDLRFESLSTLTDFCTKCPTLDIAYLEDLENYKEMDVLFERNSALSEHKRLLEMCAISRLRAELVPELWARYGRYYWRSVYQGVLRDEVNAWHSLVMYLVELLVSLGHLSQGGLPPAKKWLLSGASIRQVGAPASHIEAILSLIRSESVSGSEGVLGVYALLSRAEDILVEKDQNGAGRWWRAVFTDRLPKLPLPPELSDRVKRLIDVMSVA